MKGYGRSFAYWIYCTEKYFLILFGTVAAFLAFYGLMDGREGVLRMLPNYLPMLAFIGIIIQAFQAPIIYVPQTIAFGGTRKEAFFGMETSLHILLLQNLALMAAAVKLLPNFVKEEEIPYLYQIGLVPAVLCAAAVMLICCGIGNAICACGLKFGFKGQMLAYFICLFLFIGIMFVMSLTDNMNAAFSMEKLFQYIVKYGLAGAVVLDGIMMLLCHFGMKRFAVKI